MKPEDKVRDAVRDFQRGLWKFAMLHSSLEGIADVEAFILSQDPNFDFHWEEK